MNNFINFRKKNIIVFGASSGIGRETAILLSEFDANLVLVGRNEIELKCSADLCKSNVNINNKILYYAFDLNNIDLIGDFIKRVIKENSAIDGMVYTAGINEDLPLKSLNNDRIMRTLNTNYLAFIECVRQITMKGNYNEGLRIVGLSSVSTFFGEKAHTAYAGSKGAMDASVRAMAKELSAKGIAINTIAPGMTNTKMTDVFIEANGIDSDAYIKTMNRQYLGMAEPRDIANAICFLLSDKAKMITGITLPVDGGFTSSC